jgi:hypothetical protein
MNELGIDRRWSTEFLNGYLRLRDESVNHRHAPVFSNSFLFKYGVYSSETEPAIGAFRL